ncbi:hypothetical protein P8452_68888 [Trifolium repens]|nr:hypothetical protein P8452_68888 [Trifolium repens]
MLDSHGGFPSVEALMKTGINRTLEAVEFESGFVHLYAARCSNLKRMLPLCTDWEVSWRSSDDKIWCTLI